MTSSDDEFLTSSAVTRSMLGWGVLAGPIYFTVAMSQALAREGFDLKEHQLSLLMRGEHGWIQTANLVLTGFLVLVAAWGLARAMSGVGASRKAATLVGLFGLGMIGSGIFPPDPMAGFPPGSTEGDPTATGILHLVLGLVSFLSIATAALVFARWGKQRGLARQQKYATVSGILILVGFLVGGALSQSAAGVAMLYVAVIAGFTWLAVTCALAWRLTPHPDPRRRAARDRPVID